MNIKRLPVLVTLFVACAFAACQPQQTKVANSNAAAANNASPIQLSAKDTDAAEPALAVSRDSTIYVAWVEHQAGSAADVWLARVGSNGERLNTPVRVNPNAGEATAWRGDPPTLVVAVDNTIYVGWTRRIASQDVHASDLCLSASHDNGHTFAAPAKVNDNAQPSMHGMHSLAVAADGRIYLAWLDERNLSSVIAKTENETRHVAQAGGKFLKVHAGDGHVSMEHKMEGNREVFTAFSTNGGRTFSVNQRIATEVCPCCKTALVIASDGRVYASWRQVLPGNFRHIAVASSVDGGRDFSQPVIVSDDRWMIEACPVSGAALNVGADNRLRIMWYTAGEAGVPGLYYAESRDGGRTFTARQSFVAGEARGTPQLLYDAGSALFAVWETNERGVSHPVIAQIAADGHANNITVVANSGELPAAAMINGQLFVAYIAKENNRRGIWLVRAKS